MTVHARRMRLVLLCCLALCAPAGAQTMYKCGRQYQDRPCDSGPGRAVGSATSAPRAGTPAPDVDCTQRGESALRFAWAREGGATQEKALSNAKSAGDRELVAKVYQKQGSAPQIRAAIEAECVTEKDQAAQAAALIRALGGAPGAQPDQAVQPSISAEDLKAAEARRQQSDAERAEARKQQQCARLSADMQRLVASQRSGGGTTTMDSLNEQRRSLSRQMSDAGC